MSRVFSAGIIAASLTVWGYTGDDLYSEFSEFSTQTSVAAGVGYTENVLLGEVVQLDSAFAYFGLEGVANKSFWGDQFTWSSLAYADVRTYDKLDGVPVHAIYLLQTELESYVGLISKGRVGARYLDLTQVFDATFDELERVDFIVEGSEPEFYVGYESMLGEFEYDIELSAGHMAFKDMSNDYDSFSVEVEFERPLLDALTWKSELEGWRRQYDEKSARSLSGIPLADTLLETEMVGAETGLRFTPIIFDTVNILELTAAYREREDLVTGYYDRSRLSADIEWRTSAWGIDFDLSGTYTEYQYDHQFGDGGDLKASDSWYWELEMERKLSESWSAFLNLSTEEESSNESFASFETRTVLLGIRWR
ncbi:hypothetical protein [Pelagicoccus mobilis]|uniref:Uncharacterized protein n=1 Tax=Pelagicoccus mobilis TaxID=415221 RepID=A0A934RXL1_9BACT|nr:hypothetical protein [Pelagicoccus mobilis]MBK1879595.1 hypothetical protein [Pelagicoccus mobilis]